MTDSTTLVIGGTGKTGRRVAERLWSRGHRVRLGSRAAAIPFDWNDRATWTAALEGTDAAYISFYPDVAVPGAAHTIKALTETARATGVRRLVLLSGRGEAEAQRAEQAVRESGLDWTILRSSWFCQNFSEGHFQEPLVHGELALPAGRVGEPFVDCDDIAEVAVAALTDARHAGEIYELTGPRVLTFAEAVQSIGLATGRRLRYVELPMRDYVTGLAQAGVPPEFISLLRYLFTDVLDGRNASVQDGVERALGRRARDFATFAQAAAAAGAWPEPAVVSHAGGSRAEVELAGEERGR